MSAKKNVGHDYSAVILWSSVAIGAVRYAAAFIAADLGKIEGLLSDVISYALGLSGLAMGILGALGTAYLFDGWRNKIPASGSKWSNKFRVLTGFVFAAVLAEVLILVPFTESRVRHISISDVLQGGVWWWSAAVVMMPMILIGGVSVGNQVVTVESGQMSESAGQMSGTASKETGQVTDGARVNVPTDWRKASKVLTLDQKRALVGMRTGDICYLYGLEDRQARRWREKAAEELGATTTTAEVAKSDGNS